MSKKSVKTKEVQQKVVTSKDDDISSIVDLEFIGSKEEVAETRTIASREKLRKHVDTSIEEYLAQGGEISEIEPNVMADPPKKPVSNYGSRPI